MSSIAGVVSGVNHIYGRLWHGMIGYMSTVLGAFLAAQILELLCWFPGIWRFRRATMPLAFFLLAGSTTALLIFDFAFPAIVLTLVSLYRGVNIWRVMANRMRPEFLRRTTWRTELWLVGYNVFLLLLWLGFHWWQMPLWQFWHLFLWLELALSLILLVTTLRHARSMKPSPITDWLADKDLPTLTVAIPARNETDDLQVLLTSLVASTYPKLEVLVLDDCSTTARTPEIIRGFAHEGIRFLQGEAPKDGWLAKNQAYQRLLEESNGELVLFCGADVRFEPETLTRLVTLMLQKKKSMMSIMPRNILPRFVQLDASLIQPMRYAWEVALPRKLFRRPPVLSTCWIAKREVLLSSGGFSAVSRSIVPESYFARQSARHDGYGFRYSDNELGLISNKDVSDQRDTATRTKYPQLHRRPELVIVLTAIELFGIVMPFLFLIVGLFYPVLTTTLVVGTATCAMLVTWYMLVCTLTYRLPDIRSLVSLPFAVLLDVALLNYSMLKYEFSVVLWKDRNVCIPVMRIEPKLPDVSEKLSKA